MKRNIYVFGPRSFTFSRQILFLVCIYLIVLAFRGFLFASNDPVDVMSYAKFLSEPNLYPHDFYIQHLHSAFPNERWIFSGLLSLMGEHLRWITLLLHAITSLFLFLGIFRIASLFIKNEFFCWLVILIITGPLYGTNPGACDIYYNMFISSLVAKSLGVWSVYFFLTKKSLTTFLLLIPATMIHPTVGAQLFIILTGTAILRWKKMSKKQLFTGIVLYLLTAGIYIALLQWKLNQNSGISEQKLFEIFEFRIAHHFFPSYFPVHTYLIAIALWGFSMGYFLKRKLWNIFILQVVILAGMIFYTFFTEVYPMSSVLSSQWFKTSIWMQLTGIVGIMAWLEEQFNRSKINLLQNLSLEWSLPFGAVLVVGLVLSGNSFFSGKKYEFFFTEFYSDEAEIGLLAKKLTPHDAVFVVPMSFTEFKYFSERSLYIDYKSVVHRKDVLGAWYQRIGFVYGVDVQNRRNGENLIILADKNYLKTGSEQIKTFRKEGVGYFVTSIGHSLPFRSIGNNSKYRIYDLNVKNPKSAN